MSEYWVSKKKYHCRYCDIFINDDAPSRQLHENGPRHVSAKERFIRGIYKAGAQKKKDAANEAREMARIEGAAQAAFSQDLSSGRATGLGQSSIPSTSSAVHVKPEKPNKPSNPFANYTTAASLGIVDPDAEKGPTGYTRKEMEGVAGNWEFVKPAAVNPAQEQQKRKLLEAEENDEENVTRSHKVRKRVLAPGLGQLYDPGKIVIKPKVKDQELVKEEEPAVKEEPTTGSISESKPPVWKPLQWKRPGEATSNSTEQAQSFEDSAVPDNIFEPAPAVKQEETVKVEEVPVVDSGPAPVFRKRKGPGAKRTV